MRHLTKIISLILAVSMLMTGLAVANDTSETDYSGYVRLENIFRGIGVLTDDDVFASDYFRDITEDELNKMISNIIGTEYAEKCDGTFNFNRAVQKIITLLGYDVVAVEKGPYPDGYIKVANEIELFEGLTQKGEKSISVGEAMRLLYNAMHINVVDRTVYGDEAKYQIINETLLTLYKKMYFVRGIVTDNAITDFDEISLLDKGEIKIDGILYKTEKDKYIDLIGKVIGAYYRIDSNGQRNIIYADEEESRYNSLTLQAKDILGYSNLSFAYTSGDKAKIINLRPSIIVIYNNISTTTYTDAMFKPKSGYVEFIDNNLDGTYDVAVIKSYYNMIVRSVNPESMEVMDLNDTSKDFSLKDKEDKYIIKNIDDEIVDFGYFENYDVLSVAESENSDFTEIIVSNRFASGDVNAMFFEGMNKRIKIGDKICPLDAEYTTASQDIKAGMYGTALLDFEGEVVFFVDETGGTKYGYVISGTEKSKTFDRPVMLKLLTQDDEIIVYECDDKMIINEENISGFSNIKDKLIEVVTISKNVNNQAVTPYQTTRYKQQLIRYNMNSEGKLNYIDTIDTTIEETPDKNHLRRYRTAVSGVYLTGPKSMAAKLLTNATTNIFMIAPTKDDTANITDEERFKTRSVAVLKDGYNQATYDAYTADKECATAEVLLTTTDITLTTTYSGSTPAYLIQEIIHEIDENGDEIEKICAIKDNAYVEVPVDKDVTLSVLPGDIQRIELNDKGYAVSSTRIHRNGDIFAEKGSFYSNFYSVSGLVYNGAQNVLQITGKPIGELSDTVLPNDLKYFNSGSTYRWDTEKQKFVTAASSEISDFKHDGTPDSVLVIARNGRTISVVIFR